MSAFLCSDLHTVAIALYQVRKNCPAVETARVITMAKVLRQLNNQALSARYSDRPVFLARDIMPTIAAASKWLESASAADIRGIVECFKYQCSEGDCDTRPAWKLILDIEANARIGARASESSAVWSI